MKKYRLKKDWYYRDGSYEGKGIILAYNEVHNEYMNGSNAISFTRDFVKTNTDFFEEVKEEKIEQIETLWLYTDNGEIRNDTVLSALTKITDKITEIIDYINKEKTNGND